MRYSAEGLVLDTGSGAEENEGSVKDEWRGIFSNSLAVLIEGEDATAVQLMYEALDAGALPVMHSSHVLLRELGRDHEGVALVGDETVDQETRSTHLPRPPQSSDHDWIEKLDAALGPPQRLAARRQACQAWWQRHCGALRRRVEGALLGTGTHRVGYSLTLTDEERQTKGEKARGSKRGASASGQTRAVADAAPAAGSRQARGQAPAQTGGDATGHVGGETVSNRPSPPPSSGAAAGRGTGGVTEWAKSTLGIKRSQPPSSSPPTSQPLPPPPSHAAPPPAPAPHFPTPNIQQQVGVGGGGGHSGWRFEWQAGASVCNTYPHWHLHLCQDGAMSVHQCGRQCVHVTPIDYASLSEEPDQHKDLLAASMASHHQVMHPLLPNPLPPNPLPAQPASAPSFSLAPPPTPHTHKGGRWGWKKQAIGSRQ
jgi:hypothetical protein